MHSAGSPPGLQSAIVTGATGAVGSAVAIHLAARADRLVLVARNPARLDDIAKRCSSEACAVSSIVCDYSSRQSVQDLCDALSADGQIPRSLVHCVGTRESCPFLTDSPEAWDSAFEMNLLAPMRVSQACARAWRRMRLSGTAIVDVASVAGITGAPGAAAYAATKGAAIALARSLAPELARQGTRVLCICPGYLQSGMFEELSRRLPAAAVQAVTDAHPLGLGTPEDVALVVEAVLGPPGRWMTGTALVIDGGYSCA